MKITVDTNILVSATFWYGDSNEIIERVERKEIELILSKEIIEEFTRVLRNVVKEDSDDNKILECAKAGKVDFIVSNDNHLLKLKEFEGIKILSSADFLKIIKK